MVAIFRFADRSGQLSEHPNNEHIDYTKSKCTIQEKPRS